MSLVALPAVLAQTLTRPPLANTSAIPLNFGMIVFPGFQALDVFGPLDALSMFSWYLFQTQSPRYFQ